MSTTKQVKVDNWGVFFLQRLKHFFNRTDYCDLTLQFQDYAQLKVHRLVLNACTEYFELLERTCEMYDDCLVMPDDLQVDVVVPIVNFMYTGQLEYEFSLYDRLYSTAQIMNMTVLTKLLDAQKGEPTPSPGNIIVMNDQLDKKLYSKPTSADLSNFSKKRLMNRRQYGPGPGLKIEPSSKAFPSPRTKSKFDTPRPTRYEVPEELENEDIFESSFADISYESRPLMKPAKNRDAQGSIRSQNIYDEASCSRKFEELQRGTSYKRPRSSSSDNPDGKHIDLEQVNEFAYQQKLRSEYIAQDDQSDDDMFDSLNIEYDNKDLLSQSQVKEDSNLLFSQINDNSQSKASKSAASKDSRATFNHAKIISEVLKKYPHLVKNNKNIKLKIMSGANKAQLSPKNSPKSFTPPQPKKFAHNSMKASQDDGDVKPEWTYISKNMNSEAMAKLVSLGAGNTTGPWLCLMCGTPGKALNFSTYHNYYQHMVMVHKEKISANICEYCGYKSGKRNHLLHHLYTKHDVPPPSTHSFPKCNQCSYIALTEAFLIKHKLSHLDNREFSCNVCNAMFRTRSQMLFHIQVSGHKISPDRKASNQCVYCNKIFLRETNLYTHLKLAHKELARKDGIIDNSDEEIYDDEINYADSGQGKYAQEKHVQIKEEYDGKIQIISNNVINKRNNRTTQKVLNSQLINKNAIEQVRKGYNSPMRKLNRGESSSMMHMMDQSSDVEALGNVSSGSLGLVDRIVVLNDTEYILQSGQGDAIEQTIGHVQVGTEELILSNLPGDEYVNPPEVNRPQQTSTPQLAVAKTFKPAPKSAPVRSYINSQNQPIQIVVSGNQQFKSIASTASVVYTTGSNSSTVDSTVRYLQAAPPNTVQLQTTSEGNVMVLQDQDFNISQAMPADGSNIVVVYSHPIEDGKNYVQVDQNQYTEVHEHEFVNLSDNLQDQEIESHIDNVDPVGTESEVILSEQGIVHETVETWQEDTIEASHEDTSKEDVMEEVQCSEDVVILQEIPLSEDDKVTTSEDLSSEVHIESSDPLADVHTITLEPNEVIISEQEVENHISSETDIDEQPNIIADNSLNANIEEVSSSIDQEIIEDPLGEPGSADQDEIVSIDQPDNLIVMEPDEAMEVGHDESSVIDNEVSVEAVDVEETIEHEGVIEDEGIIQHEGPIEHIEKLASEWSDDETSQNKVSTLELDNSDLGKEEVLVDPSMEVEESIENIEKEVQKHILQKEREAESKSAEQSIESTEKSLIEESAEDIPINETTEDVPSSNDIIEEVIQNSESEILCEELTEDNGHDVDSSTPEETELRVSSTLKQKTVEKISNLLNDWEDNDSQSEAMEVDGKKGTVEPPKDPIHKLVSDWDDEEDK